MQNLYGENELYLRENKNNHFQINGFSLSLGLKQRLKTAGNCALLCTYELMHFQKQTYQAMNVYSPLCISFLHTLFNTHRFSLRRVLQEGVPGWGWDGHRSSRLEVSS